MRDKDVQQYLFDHLDVAFETGWFLTFLVTEPAGTEWVSTYVLTPPLHIKDDCSSNLVELMVDLKHSPKITFNVQIPRECFLKHVRRVKTDGKYRKLLAEFDENEKVKPAEPAKVELTAIPEEATFEEENLPLLVNLDELVTNTPTDIPYPEEPSSQEISELTQPVEEVKEEPSKEEKPVSKKEHSVAKKEEKPVSVAKKEEKPVSVAKKEEKPVTEEKSTSKKEETKTKEKKAAKKPQPPPPEEAPEITLPEIVLPLPDKKPRKVTPVSSSTSLMKEIQNESRITYLKKRATELGLSGISRYNSRTIEELRERVLEKLSKEQPNSADPENIEETDEVSKESAQITLDRPQNEEKVEEMSDAEVETALSEVLSAPVKKKVPPRKPRILPAFILKKLSKEEKKRVTQGYPSVEEVTQETRISYMRDLGIRARIPNVAKFKKGDIEVLRELILEQIEV
jgi:hypothetical protein